MYDTTTLAPASQPAVTYNGSSNRFLVTWQRVNYELPVVYQIQSRTTSTMGIIGTVVTLANRTTSLTAPAAAVAGNGQFLVVWQGRRNGNDDIYGQRLTASGGLTGGNFVIANSNSAEMAPALVWHSSANAYLVVWQRDGNVWARP
ncbi:MAG: hypothetical protein IAE79_25250, partial [Anaerolinea sp.]|nr:hypothetical protein [Anaerolinea sp.]